MADKYKDGHKCRAAEIRIMMCCDLLGTEETLRLLGYARALHEYCQAHSMAPNMKPC